MENVIKQGYLKKGNSTEGGVFSGIIEKMAPWKWYMLVVRSRVPYLEQYERDVDVFSSTPSVVHNLSVVTSVSRTMATTARTFNFFLVCPDHLIELIAHSRDQMRDWCDALERTLHSLGILKSDKEEHIYTFCPAVSNLVGRSQENKEDEEESEEELGAIGGAPALPPPPRPPPPVVGNHPFLLPRTTSEPTPALNDLSPPPLPACHPPPLRKAGSTTTSLPDRSPSPPSIRPPPLPSAPLLPLPCSNIPSDIPPPLPRARPGVGSSIPDRPPPLPPARPAAPPISSQQKKSLPPEPPSDSKNSRESTLKASTSIDSEDSESDYSSDFVSGSFWVINRKTPVPTARHAVLPPKSSNSPKGATSTTNGVMGNSVSDETRTGATGAVNVEELDEGYSDLATVKSLKKSDTVGESTDKSDQYAKVMKKSAVASGSSSRDSTESESEKSQRDSTGSVEAARESGSIDSSQTTIGVDSEDSNITTQVETGPDPIVNHSENFYAPFPGDTNGGSAASEKDIMDDKKEQSTDSTALKRASSSSQQESSSAALPSDDLEQDNVYACAAEASSIPTTSVPPLPPRQDSLPSWKGDSPGDISNGSSVSGTSQAEAAVPRPIPARRKTVHPISLPPPSNGNPQNRSVTATYTPPIPPRRGVFGMGKSCDSALDPPPLPTRNTQSFRSQRPFSASDKQAVEGASDSTGVEDQTNQPSHQPASLSRQQSMGSADASGAENSLRQRMRVDREHSIHSVISLKQSQAEILRQEMELPGVTVTVSERAAQGIALVDCGQAVCIAGWNQKDFPSLHGKFHIGDQLISICNVKVTSAAMAQKILKHPATDIVEMLLKRTPHAIVLAIRRAAEGQSIGIKRNGGTAEILYVDPNGLAATNGLPQHAPGILSGQGRSNWVLTEINSRPLSLFFKDNEIDHRLNAVGREITIVTQPSDYIGELKKQLKKLKNYKNYIVQ